MANRHANKKMRGEIRARMAATGETYQQARTQVLAGHVSARGPRADLVAVTYHGLPATLATIEMHGMAVAFLIPSSRLWTNGYPSRAPIPMLRVRMQYGAVQ